MEGGVKLSKTLSDIIGLPRDTPPEGLHDLANHIRRASLISTLKADTLFPGTKVDSSGEIVELRGERPPIMRKIRMGEVYEKPLSPGSKWEKAKGKFKYTPHLPEVPSPPALSVPAHARAERMLVRWVCACRRR